MKVLVVSKRVKWWSPVVAQLRPCGVTLKIYNPMGFETVDELLKTINQDLSQNWDCIVCEFLPIYHTLPQYITLPATPPTATAFVDFLLRVYKSLKESAPFPSLVLLLPQGFKDDVESLLKEWSFPILSLGNARDDTFYIVGIKDDKLFLPESKCILLPNEGAAYAFASFIRKFIYSYVPYDVLLEKERVEAELSKEARLLSLKRRRRNQRE